MTMRRQFITIMSYITNLNRREKKLMFCRKCGKQLPDQARFCNACGTQCPPRENVAAVPQPEAPAMPVEEVSIPCPVQEIAAQPEEKPVEEITKVIEEAACEEAGEVPAEVPEEMSGENIAEATEEVTEETPEEAPGEETEEALETVSGETPDEQVEEASEEAPAEEAGEAPAEASAEEPVQVVEAPVPIPVETPRPMVAPSAPEQKVSRNKRPHIAVRVLMQILSFLICLALLATVTAVVAVADLRQVTSGDGLKQILNTLLNGNSGESTAYVAPPVSPDRETGYGAVTLASGDFNVEDIPDEILANGDVDALADWIYEQLQKRGEKINFTQQEFRSFVNKSTVKDYATEKLAGFAEDAINGTDKTVVTTEEIMDLMEENQRYLKSELNVELTEENKNKIRQQVEDMVEKQDLSNSIRQTLNETADKVLQEGLGVNLESARRMLSLVTSDLALALLITLCVVLMGLLLLLNYYNMGAGLTWGASAGLLAGFVLSVPLLLVRYASGLVTDIIPALERVLALVKSFMGVLAPIHYGLLIGSAALLVISIVWRVVAAYLRNRREETEWTMA